MYRKNIIPGLTPQNSAKQVTFSKDVHNRWGLPGQKFLWLMSDEKWFWGLVARSNAKAIPELGLHKTSYSAHHKNHIAKVMAHATVGFAFEGSPEDGGDGLLVGLHRCQGMRVFERDVRFATKDPITNRTTFKGNPIKYHKNKPYLVDCNVTGSNRGSTKKPCFALKDLWESNLIPAIKELVKPGAKYHGYTVVFQEDNAGPHQEGNYSAWLRDEFAKHGWHVRLQAPQGPYTNVLDLALFPSMSKRHSEKLQMHSNTVATAGEIWEATEGVWTSTTSGQVAQSFVQAYRVMGKIINEGGNNHWLQNGGPHCGVRNDFYETQEGCKPKV
jgi:hypothetical protein